MNSNEIKLQSKKLKLLSKKYGYEIKHSHALEIISQLQNEANWHISSLDNPDYIKTGLTELDKALGGGLKKGSQTTILGKTNSGKTSLGLSLVCNALRKKKKVLVYKLENIHTFKNQIISNLSNIPLSKIISNNLSNKEINTIEKIKKNILNKVIIRDNMDHSIESLKESIFNERSSFQFDLLFIDSADLLFTNKHNTIRSKMIYTHKQLDMLAKAYNCTVITSKQASKAAQDKSIIKFEDTPGFLKLNELPGNILSINKDSNNQDIKLYLEKTYENKTNKLFNTKAKFSISKLLPDV